MKTDQQQERGPWDTALDHGATIAEIIEVLKLCVLQGVQANLGVPMLAKELADRSARNI